ncbi:MAG TPA: DUF6316 family protein [Pseudomonadales bacterium]
MRKDDPSHLKKRFFRSNDRFFQINGQWYFSAREGDIGPFRSREQAKREAQAYIAARLASETPSPKRARRREITGPTVIPGFVYRSVLSMEEQVTSHRDLVLDLEDTQ